MRQIQLDGSPSDIGLVWATMLFPNEQSLREQYFAVHLARSEESKAEPDSTVIQLTRRHLGLLLDAPSYADLKMIVADRTKQATIAGDLMLALYVMDYFKLPEPSMRKAEFVAAEYSKKATYGDGSKIAGSHPMIIRAWNAYKDVAHLWAALFINDPYPYAPSNDEIFASQYFPRFLCVSATIQRFGVSFIPFRAKKQKPVLDSGAIWWLPKHISPISPIPNYPNRPTILEKTLKRYRAKS